MARRRFFVDQLHSGRASLTGEAAEHLRRVLRAEPGQKYEIADNQAVYLAEVESFQKGVVWFQVGERVPDEPEPLRLTLLASLIKFDRFEWIVEKATELGVEAIIPVVAARSEKGLDLAAAKRSERWRRIALESSQQSRRARLPALAPCISLGEGLATAGRFRYFLDENRDAPAILSALSQVRERSSSDCVCLVTGPEGGWTDQEREEALRAGWTCVSLGQRILRAETAALAAISVVTAFWSDAAK